MHELEDAKEAKRAKQDCQRMMTAMGQMMGIFAQYMVTGGHYGTEVQKRCMGVVL